MNFPRWKTLLAWLLPCLLFCFLAFDGNHHWDETNYLYKGAFSELSFNASWVHYYGGFYSGRLFHIFLLNVLFSLFGLGVAPLLFLQTIMALFVLGAGWFFSRALRELGLPSPLPYLGAVAFLFLPLSLYLGYKALPETTALLLTALALWLYFSGLKKTGSAGVVAWSFSAAALFLATNSRVESLLTFATLTLPCVCFLAGKRMAAFRGLAVVGSVWAVLTAVLGLSTGVWSLEFLLRRSEYYGHAFAADAANYPANPVVGVLFGGGLWLFALLALTEIRRAEVKIAWGGLIISMLPIALLADHTELRYYNPAVFSLALAVALGVGNFYDRLKWRLAPRPAGAVTAILFLGLVAGNQLFRPIQEVGTHGLPLIRLMNRAQGNYSDPLVLTAHPHTTYSFLRICYPETRIVLDRDYEDMAPLKVESPEELTRLKEPWLYLSSRGPRDRPFLMKAVHRFRGVEPTSDTDQLEIATDWVAPPGPFSLELVDRENRYLLFEIRQDGTGVD